MITGLKFDTTASDYTEDLNLPLSPRTLARILSKKKAEAVAHKYKNAIIIAADTFIVSSKKLLGKPHTDKEAEKMLKMLSGKAHSVITGFTILDTCTGKVLSRSVKTKVYFRKLDPAEIKKYVNTGEPLDKAGAYAIQGLAAAFISKIEGDFFNVVGLPLCALTESLKKFKIHLSYGRSLR